MTDSIYTIAILTVASGMTVIAGILSYLYRQRDGQFEAAAKQVNALTTKLEREELLTKRLDESGKRSEETANYYMTRCDQLQDERDTLRRTIQGLEGTQTQLERIISDLSAERATLYRRNAKGQIEPITPKPRKPHTLKHGMTVKDPTEAQGKRIFAEARKAGIHLEHLNDDEEIVSLVFSSSDNNSPEKDTLIILGVYVTEAIYITFTEFIRRIRGEQE
jgi:exonuclease VII small subunit